MALRFARTMTTAHYASALPCAGAQLLHAASPSLLYLINLPLALHTQAGACKEPRPTKFVTGQKELTASWTTASGNSPVESLLINYGK